MSDVIDDPMAKLLASANEDWDAEFGAGVVPEELPNEDPVARLHRLQRAAADGPADGYFEPCRKCRGTGRTPWGVCFRCQGAKGKTYKTSPEQRQKAREGAAQRLERKVDAWAEEHAAEHAWIVAKAPSFGFAASMLEALRKYQHLTEGQLAAVRKCIAADAERNAKRAAERAAREEHAKSVDITPIREAFYKAQLSGLTRIKLRLDAFVFSLAPAHSKNAGAIYVKEGQEYLGKIAGGRFYATRECGAEREARILAACADPKAAAIAYGQRTGSCSCCGRELTNEGSIEAGIGPICAGKMGW